MKITDEQKDRLHKVMGYLIRKYKSNNWLKMHGYPMRRRKRR